MLIVTREDTESFPRDRVPDLVLLSSLFARATQTVVLSQAVKEAFDGLDYELRSIAEIQRSLLPAQTPKVPGLDVAVHYQTAKRPAATTTISSPAERPAGRYSSPTPVGTVPRPRC